MDSGMVQCTTEAGELGWAVTLKSKKKFPKKVFVLARCEFCLPKFQKFRFRLREEPSGGWTAEDTARGYLLVDCKPTLEICPPIWNDTAAAFECANDASCTSARPKPWFGCPYSDGHLNRNQSQIASGCCGGFQDMLLQTNADNPPTIYAITEGGTQDASGVWSGGTPTGKKTQCWASNGGTPLEAWRNKSNFNAENKVWIEGQDVELAWMSTANHGGALKKKIPKQMFGLSARCQ